MTLMTRELGVSCGNGEDYERAAHPETSEWTKYHSLSKLPTGNNLRVRLNIEMVNL